MLAGAALENVVDQADFDGPLVDSGAKGSTVELVGKADVAGTEAYRLRITKANGDVIDSYLDTESWLEIGQEGMREIDGRRTTVRATIHDYRQVGDILMPHTIASSPVGSSFNQTIVFEKVSLDVEVDDEIFALPAVP